MGQYAKAGLGATLSWDGSTVAEIQEIGGVKITAEPIDVTTLEDAFKRYIPGIPGANAIPINGFFYPGDTNGQVALETAIAARSTGAVIITLPAAFATTWSFTGIVTEIETGKEDTTGAVPFMVSIQPNSSPTLSITASTGLTTPFFAISESAVITPDPANAIYDYVATVLTGISSVTVTPTASAGTIVITANGASQTVASGNPSSAITLGAAGTNTTVTITVTETNKMPKTYTIRIARAAT